MSIHYKFKSALDYDTITFDGLHISVSDLKKSIVFQKKLGKATDFDLRITNAQTNEGMLYFKQYEIKTEPNWLYPFFGYQSIQMSHRWFLRTPHLLWRESLLVHPLKKFGELLLRYCFSQIYTLPNIKIPLPSWISII